MKKLIFASVMASACLSLFFTPVLRAQDSTITIKDPAEYNTYQGCTTQSGNQDRDGLDQSQLDTP